MTDAFNPYHAWLGIAPADQPPNHYQLLGVPDFESNLDVIQSAADRQMGHLKSFQAGKHSAESQRLLNEVSAARVCLLKPEKKAAYDAMLCEAMGDYAEKQATPWRKVTVPVAMAVGILTVVAVFSSRFGSSRQSTSPTTANRSEQVDQLDARTKDIEEEVDAKEGKATQALSQTANKQTATTLEQQTISAGPVRLINQRHGRALRNTTWLLVQVGENYQLREIASGECLALCGWAKTQDDARAKGGASLVMIRTVKDPRSNGLACWTLRPLGDDLWAIANCETGKCLESRTRPGNVWRQSEFRPGDIGQQWRIVPVKE